MKAVTVFLQLVCKPNVLANLRKSILDPMAHDSAPL
jgi:hypothetical protein